MDSAPAPADGLILRVGRRIGDLRRAAGLTQAEFAVRADVSLKYVQRVEAGEENLSLRSLARYADILQVEVMALFADPERRRRRPGRPRR